MTEGVLGSALGHMASYLRNKNENITIFGIGGAWLVLMRKGRRATHDFNYILGSDVTPEQLRRLKEAARYAKKKMPSTLRERWFNTETKFATSQDRNKVIEAALASDRNVTLWSTPRGGLRVVQVPLEVAFLDKLNKIGLGESNCRFDFDDAVDYLHALGERYERLTNRQVADWQLEYDYYINLSVLSAVRQHYEARYKKSPFANM